MEINIRLEKLRELMTEKKIDAYIIPSFDAHQSEYVADYYKGREWISGFTGSAGTVVVTHDKAILWTDGRYFIQAENQLSGSEFQLFKMGIPGFPTYIEWLKDNLKDGNTLGFDGKVFPQSEIINMQNVIGEKGVKLNGEYDLLDEIWEDRTALPSGNAFIHDIKYTGKSAKEKIEEVRNEMRKFDVDYFILASLDDIAWLYNIRGNDVSNNPVVISYAIISKDKSYLFVDNNKIDNNVEKFLNDNNIEIKEYSSVIDYVKNIEKDSRIFLDADRINNWIFNSIPKGTNVINGMNITTKLKGIKNSVEIENQKNAYIKDGVALTKFLYWLDKNIDSIELYKG